jgi:hypothetical protein
LPPSQQKLRRIPERCGGGAAPPPRPGWRGASSPRPLEVSTAAPTQSAARRTGTGRSPQVTCAVTQTQNRMNYRRRAPRWRRMRKAFTMPSPALRVKNNSSPKFSARAASESCLLAHPETELTDPATLPLASLTSPPLDAQTLSRNKAFRPASPSRGCGFLQDVILSTASRVKGDGKRVKGVCEDGAHAAAPASAVDLPLAG